MILPHRFDTFPGRRWQRKADPALVSKQHLEVSRDRRSNGFFRLYGDRQLLGCCCPARRRTIVRGRDRRQNDQSDPRPRVMRLFAEVWAAARTPRRHNTKAALARSELSSRQSTTSIFDGRADFLQASNEECALDCLRQIFRATAAPVMEKHDPRLFVRHVRVNGDDVDLLFYERFQNRL